MPWWVGKWFLSVALRLGLIRDFRKKRRQLPGAFVTHQYQPVYSVGPGLDNWKNPVAAGVPFCDPSTVGRQAVGIGAQVL